MGVSRLQYAEPPAWTAGERWLVIVLLAVLVILLAWLATSSLLLPPVVLADATASGISKIAFSSLRAGGDFHVFLATPNGSTVTRVTTGPYGGDGAALSPEGTRLVYESPRNGWAQLFMINTDGTGEHRVLSTTFYGQSATWSPDGQRLAFSHSSNNGQVGGTGSTWVVNAGGGIPSKLSPVGANDWGPDWSPDGTKLAFYSEVDGHYEIFVMNVDRTGRRQVTSGTGDRFSPRWSPDGTRLAYALCPVAGVDTVSSIRIVGADGSGDVAVTDSTGVNTRPAWSPTGDRISFSSNRSGCFQIYTIATDGTDLQRVTWVENTPGDLNGSWGIVTLPADVEGPGDASSPRWSVTSPARGTSTIRFTLARESEARLDVHDSAGRRVRALLCRRLAAGTHAAVWDGRDDGGGRLPAGVYHCRLTSDGGRWTAKIALVR